jgi:CRP-like cAMP-binding protein
LARGVIAFYSRCDTQSELPDNRRSTLAETQTGSDKQRSLVVASFLLEHTSAKRDTPLELQHRLVASLLDLRPETLSRVLQKPRQAGVIAGTRKVRLLNRT